MKTDKKMKKDKKFLEYLWGNKEIVPPQKRTYQSNTPKKQTNKKKHEFEQVPIGQSGTNCTSK